jgi:hypothetical protein
VKPELSIISVLAGMQIVINDEQFWKADAPSRNNFDPESNVTSESESQSLKQE